MTPEERDLLAAEYVLGTLNADERATAARLIASGSDFAAAVQAWEDRFAPLDGKTAPVPPRSELFARIEAAIDAGAKEPVSSAAENLDAGPVLVSDADARLADSAGYPNVLELKSRVWRWRAFTAASTALAAGLAAILVIDRLPAPPVGSAGRYLAVVNTDGSLPAMIVDVDTIAGVVTVRTLAVERPVDTSLELWAIPEGGQPISLGLVDPEEPVLRIRPDRAGVIPTRGAFAVSVEPVGGSPTGAPTGPVVYSGALVPAE